ncbi:MAG: helix-turn-helix transcriptional regulator [Clostridium lundense]|nr:helix-turn-helix transcriptional regulator [Clostridium lundense]
MLLNDIIESYTLASNEDAAYFRQKVELLSEKMIKVASKFKFRNSNWINAEHALDKFESFEDMKSISNYIYNILTLIFSETPQNNIEVKKSDVAKPKCLNKALEPALKYIEENYGEQVSLEDVASVSNLSPYYFSKLFKKEIGMNFTTYVTKHKIEKAKWMLKNTDIPIVNIASELGYYECGYFTKVFKKIEGITPTEYRSKDD